MNISFVIPVYNNFKYTKHVYQNIREYYPNDEIVISDGGSSDETTTFFSSLADPNLVFVRNGKVNLCENYNKGVEAATQQVVVLLHNDMFIPPNFKQRLLEDLTEDTVVSFSRIEPPIYPGEEPGKIVRDFGYDLDTLNKAAIIAFCEDYKDKYEGGGYLFIACYKNNYLGLDERTFNPPQCWTADDDLHIRYKLTGKPRIISSACVYHFVSRTSRSTNDYQQVELHANKNYIRKWGGRHAMIKYNVGYVVQNCTAELLSVLEPWCDTIYLQDNVLRDSYCVREQPNTIYCLPDRVRTTDFSNQDKPNNILVQFDGAKLTNENFQLLTQLPQIIEQTNELGQFELDIFTITIKDLTQYQNNLIHIYN
jgi:glycosyltransferase involved in cell wall biosynthesis